MSTNNWYYVAGTWDGSLVRIYVNGIQRDTTTTNFNNLGNNNYGVRFGRGTYDADRRFDGTIDEIRISTVARPVEWIETSFNNQSNPGVGGFLLSVGSEELGP